MRYLIFDPVVRGHHIEYCLHLYKWCISELSPDSSATFILGSEVGKYVEPLETKDNVSVDYLSDEIAYKIRNCNFIKSSWYRNKILRAALAKNYFDRIILIESAPYLPFIFISGFPKHSIRAIEYRIPVWRKKPIPLKTKIFDYIKLFIYAKGHCFDKIFLLNDKITPQLYNAKFKTLVFSFLPDPYIPLAQNTTGTSKRSSSKLVTFLHAGALDQRKGTLTILQALQLLSLEDAARIKIIIAGEPSPQFDNSIRFELDKISTNLNIEYIPQFVSYENLGRLFEETDYVLIPYENTMSSSGIIGYAAQFGKPVIGPNSGLLGHLIEYYHLGITLSHICSESLSTIIKSLSYSPITTIDGTNYVQDTSLKEFTDTIFL